jgi:hypothetical protein
MFKEKIGFVISVIYKIMEESSTIYWNVVLCQILYRIVSIIIFAEIDGRRI